MFYALVAFSAYLLGSIPAGFLAGRAQGVDLRKAGSGNIGATNAVRVLGKKWGYFVFACDIAKGILAVALARTVVAEALGLNPVACGVIASFFVVLGHNFPVWLGFKGGKGIATSAGVIAGLFPFPVLALSVAAWVIVFFTTRYVSVASLAGATMFPVSLIVLWMFDYPGTNAPYVCVSLVMWVLALWRHRGNMQRLANGTEPRFDRKRKESRATP